MMELGGLDLESWRILIVLGMIGGLMLFIYKIVCLIELMKPTARENLENIEKLIYAGIIFFIPLGIGGFIYQYSVKAKSISNFFVIGFLMAVIPAAILGLAVTMNATSFNLDYLSW